MSVVPMSPVPAGPSYTVKGASAAKRSMNSGSLYFSYVTDTWYSPGANPVNVHVAVSRSPPGSAHRMSIS